MLNRYESFLFEGKIIEKKFADDLVKNCGGTIIESSVKDDIKRAEAILASRGNS